MASWIEPIFDRTQGDVDFAIAQISEWKKNGSTSTDELKGCLNVTDLNRIENDIVYLSEKLADEYYFSNTSSKTWSRESLPNTQDIDRIIGNVRELILAYFQDDSAPELPKTMLSYEHINAIEENLFLIKQILDDMKSHYRECGTFYCGEE